MIIAIPGKPQPKERPRRAQAKSGKVVWYTPAATQRYERHVATCALAARQLWTATHHLDWPLLDAYEVQLEVTFRDKRIADLDNVIKSVVDGAEGVLWRNDRQCVRKTAWRTAPSKEREGVTMIVTLRPADYLPAFMDPTT